MHVFSSAFRSCLSTGESNKRVSLYIVIVADFVGIFTGRKKQGRASIVVANTAVKMDLGLWQHKLSILGYYLSCSTSELLV